MLLRTKFAIWVQMGVVGLRQTPWPRQQEAPTTFQYGMARVIGEDGLPFTKSSEWKQANCIHYFSCILNKDTTCGISIINISLQFPCIKTHLKPDANNTSKEIENNDCTGYAKAIMILNLRHSSLNRFAEQTHAIIHYAVALDVLFRRKTSKIRYAVACYFVSN